MNVFSELRSIRILAVRIYPHHPAVYGLTPAAAAKSCPTL